ncbi:hypothetical protein JCM11251_001776 [Rhodosporidiobolus azoricus]
MRRRRGPADGTTAGSKPAGTPVSASPSSSSPTSPATTSARSRPSRAKLLLFGAPLLALWYLVITRRVSSGRSQVLPAHFALCSPSSQPDGILTMDETTPGALRTQCIVSEDGLIVGRGILAEVREEWGDLATYGPGKGRKGGVKIFFTRPGEVVMPGLIDAHAHVLAYGESKQAVDLVGATSVKEVVERIAAFVLKDEALKKDKSRFILGLGWDQTKFSDTKGAFPTASDLDRDPRLHGRPIYLKRIDVHALWVSPAILRLLPPNLPSTVPGGEIVRLPDNSPSGVFLDNAMQYILAVIPPWTPLSRLSFLRRTAHDMLHAGLTGVHDAALSPSDVSFFRTLDEGNALLGEKKRVGRDLKSRLPMRVYGMVGCEPTNAWCGEEVERYEGERFTVRAAKIFTDGALGSWGAAMHEPYSDAPDKKGILISPAEDIQPLVEKGFQVNSHGIGDRANTVILDAYENVLRNLTAKRLGKGEMQVTEEEVRETQREVRLRNEHAQIMTPSDLARMGRLGIVASFQPTHATSDMAYAESRLGSDRVKGAYAWRTMIDGRAPFALGSDFPVEGVNPFLGIAAAVTRKWVEGERAGGSPHGEEGWYPHQRLTPLEALRGFTTSAAYASFSSSTVGSLEVGKYADFIVVDGDPLVLGTELEGESKEERRRREKRLRELKVRTTVVEGRAVVGSL